MKDIEKNFEKFPPPRKKVLVLCSNFLWSGGIDFIRNISSALAKQALKNNLEIYILIPEDQNASVLKKIKNFPQWLKKIVIKIIVGVKRGKMPVFRDITGTLNQDNVLDVLGDISNTKIISCENTDEQNLKTIRSINPDIILPVVPGKYIGTEKEMPWIGYIFDCQHRYLRNFYSDKKYNDIEKKFSEFTKTAKSIIVNSKTVKKDIEKFYPDAKCKIFSLPYAPIAETKWLAFDKKEGERVKNIYKLSEKYFIISNQFWIHKSHITVFEAMAILKKEGYKNLPHIVCTGKETDHRAPDYFKELKKKIDELEVSDTVHFLGFIPKKDQIEIMRNSLAVIQPTLFEGGPGGGCVYDAVSIGVPCIISDIPPNKEVTGENIFLFTAGDPKSLALQIKKFLSQEHARPDEAELLRMREKYSEDLGAYLILSIKETLQQKA